MQRMRFRDLGFSVGSLTPGPLNAITDVAGVKVGHVTLVGTAADPAVCTGVTAVLPREGRLFTDKVVAAAHVINGFGKTAGLVQVQELGTIEAPILLTNTFSVPAASEGALRFMLREDPGIGDDKSSINIVCGECNDSYLNDMRGLHVRPDDAIAAIEAAHGGEVPEGAIGAGRGMRCFGWKGGIGTSSRTLHVQGEMHHIGLLVLANFGKAEELTILGHAVGKTLMPPGPEDGVMRAGSIMLVLATDLGVDSAMLLRLARRTAVGLARVGSQLDHGSGDIVIAFSTADLGTQSPLLSVNPDTRLLDKAFRAVAEATEEAVLNALCMAETTRGRAGRVLYALPHDKLRAQLNG